MSLTLKDRCKQKIAANAGTGSITLSTSVRGFKTISSALSNGDTSYFCLESANGDWEVFSGTYTASGATISRDTTLASSNSGNKIDIGTSITFCYIVYPADKAAYKDGSGRIVSGAAGIIFSDNTVQTTAPAAVDLTPYALLPDTLPAVGTLLSYGGSRQLAAGGTVTHSVPTASTKGLILKTTDDSIDQPIFEVQTSVGTSLHRIQGSYAYFANLSVASALVGSMINVGNTGYVQWGSRSIVFAPASSQFSFRNLAETAGATLDVTTDGTLAIKDRAGTATGNLTCGAITASGNISTSGAINGTSILCDGSTVFDTSGYRLDCGVAGGFNTLTVPVLLQLGGTTSAYPAIKRSGTTTAFRLADDSADGPISCGAITASGTVTASTNVVVGSSSFGYSSYLHKGINSYGVALGFSNTGTPNTAFNFEFGNVRFQMVGVGASLDAGPTIFNPDVTFSRNSTGPKWSSRADGGLEIRNIANSADAALTCGAITASGLITRTAPGAGNVALHVPAENGNTGFQIDRPLANNSRLAWYGSGGSIVGSIVDSSGMSVVGAWTYETNSTSSTPTLKLNGTWYSGGTATTTKPHLLIEPTGTTSTAWSTSGTGIGVNAATGFTGNLADIQVNGTSVWKMNYTGQVTATNDHFFGSGVVLSWSTRFQMRSIAIDQMRMTDANATKGYVLSSATDGTMTVLDKTGSLAGNLTCGAITASGTIRQAAEITYTPTGTTQTITLNDGNHQTLNLTSATGAVTVTLTVPTSSSAGTIIVNQHASVAKDLTWAVSSGTIRWMGTEPTWASDAANAVRIISWRWNGSIMYLAATDVGT